MYSRDDIRLHELSKLQIYSRIIAQNKNSNTVLASVQFDPSDWKQLALVLKLVVK